LVSKAPASGLSKYHKKGGRMKSLPYQSQSYPSLSQLIQITARDYAKLRLLMMQRGELSKFTQWQRGKYFLLSGHAYVDPSQNFNKSVYGGKNG
jgi:hypothetical protein